MSVFVIAALLNDNVMRARSVDDGVEPRYETIQIAPAKRDANANPNAIDAVNVNVRGDQGMTLTFVERMEEAEDEV